MYRYVVFNWDAKDVDQTASARRLTGLLISASSNLQRVIDKPGLRVFDAPHPRGAFHSYTIAGGAGVVLGKVFKNDVSGTGPTVNPEFDDYHSKRVLKSKGKYLVENYWGHYVAVLRPSGSEKCYVLRDPTGGMQCYMMRSAGVSIFVSDIEDCVRLNLAPFSIDWDHLTAFFQHTRLVTQTTGFKEVTRLYGGECLVTKRGIVEERSFYWDPVDICERNTIEDHDTARAALGAVVRHCVAAWASSYDSAVHELSGGLDSSIVAACLGGKGISTDLVCFNYHTEISEGDERPYARAVALHSDCELAEREVRVSERTLKELLSPTRYATPAMQRFESPLEAAKQQLVTDRRAGAVFSGHGGDQLFQEERSPLIAAEYAFRHGLRPKLCEVIRDTSKLTSRSVWSVVRNVVGYGLLRRNYDPYTDYATVRAVLSNDTRESFCHESYKHPWVKNASMLPASKVRHILNVVDCQPFHQVPCSYAEQVHPLISQPVIELCLQIPTYVLTYGGMTRQLIRDAFEADVPATILQRRTKGNTTSYYGRLLAENATFLRSFLLDGMLVQKGMLDRVVLERLLSDRELILGRDIVSIMCSVAAEKWLSNWGDVHQRTAA